MARAWEQYGPLHPGYAADLTESGFDSSSDAEVAPSTEEAGEHLAELLVNLRLRGYLSAKQCCIIAYWAHLAGARGPCKDFAMPPDLQSGAYQRKLGQYLRVDDDAKLFYTLPVPGQSKAEAARVVHQLEVVPPHESIHAEIERDPTLVEKVATSADEWSDAYKKHPVVMASAPRTVVPLALYIDGVPFTKHDSFLAFWVYNLITMERHLVAVIRKSCACACGCRRWCSIWPILDFLRWSLAALAAGTMPERRHDGAEWHSPTDDDRAWKAGAAITKGAVVMLKGDWSEFALTLGFPTWSSGAHPCMFCTCTSDNMYTADGLSPLGFPFPLKTDESLDAACRAAEVWVTLDESGHRAVLAALRYDKRRQGARGRSLIAPLPAYGLRLGDRLEPHSMLRDVAEFDQLAVFLVRVLFWRRSSECGSMHRNPLFDPALGIGLGTMAIDALHTLSLGIYQKLVAKVCWTLIQADVWGTRSGAGGGGQAKKS